MKITGYSSRGPGIPIPSTPIVTHSCLQLQFQRILRPPRSSVGTRHAHGSQTYRPAKKSHKHEIKVNVKKILLWFRYFHRRENRETQSNGSPRVRYRIIRKHEEENEWELAVPLPRLMCVSALRFCNWLKKVAFRNFRGFLFACFVVVVLPWYPFICKVFLSYPNC